MNDAKQLYHEYRFPPTIISHAVWLYHRFCLSLRDVEDLLAERGIARLVKKLIRIAISASYLLLSVSQCLCVLPQMRLRIG